MATRTFQDCIKYLSDRFSQLPDKRVGNNQFIKMKDVGLSAFAVFFNRCKNCSTKHHRNGEVTYTHSMVSAAFVHPDRSYVIPLPPEFIQPQDGCEKENCERNAARRWLKGQGKRYADLGATILGDDLYCCQPMCNDILEGRYNFIFTCKSRIAGKE